MTDIIIRPEMPGDIGAISRVIEAAFERPDEAQLVEHLRGAGDIILSLVAMQEDCLIGHTAFSRMTAPFSALGLAPVSVSPDHQRRGIGKTLIAEGLARAKGLGWDAVFVLGEPAYYQQFGFSVDLAAGFASPYAGSYFMVLPLRPPLQTAGGRVDHAPAFSHPG